jgi:hypothetical protein
MEDNEQIVYTITKVSEAKKYKENPFVDDVFKIDSKKKTIIAGRTDKIFIDKETGELEGVAMLHRYKEVDREKFVKLYLSEINSLFELSKSGIKVFSYILHILSINSDSVYIYIPDLMEFCGYKNKTIAYRGLGELLSSKIIALSIRQGWWYVNPKIVFNGDRIVFMKEYRLVKKNSGGKQLQLNEHFEKSEH